MLGAIVAVGVSLGLQAVVGMGVVLGRAGQVAVLLGVFAITTAYTLFFLLRRIMRKAVTRRTVTVGSATEQAQADEAPAAESTPVSPPPDLQTVQRITGAERLAGLFTDQMLERLGEGFAKLDAGQRFALDVYAGGAIEALVQSLGLSRDDFQALLTDPLQRLKAPPELIERFGGLIEGYLSQPRVSDLYDRGREAMTQLLAGRTDAIDPAAALQAWDGASQNTPEPSSTTPQDEADLAGDADDPASSLVAVLYTDAAMATAGQSRKTARRIFKAHAKIARDALAALDGTEFEHDGDGILASFKIPSQAVDAALQIQADIAAAEGRQKTATGLAARIGIDVGESASQDGELVGNTVELASFLSTQGAPGQILTSRMVRDLCSGRGHQFDHRGDQQIEGFAEAVSSYELVGHHSDRHSGLTDPTEETE